MKSFIKGSTVTLGINHSKLLLLITCVLALSALSACNQAPNKTFGMYAYDPAITTLESARANGLGPDVQLEVLTHQDGSLIVVQSPAALDESCVKDATASFGPDGRPALIIKFKSSCAEALETFTGANVGKLIAVAVNGQVLSTPRINEAISGGQIVIEGQFDAIGY